MPEEKNPQLEEINSTLEHGVAASAEVTKAVNNLETPLEAIVKNTTPKDVQKIKLEGVEVITLKGDKGDNPTKEELVPIINELIPPLIPAPIKGDTGPAFTYEDFTPEQIDRLKVKGDQGDSVTPQDLLPVIKKLIPKPIKGDSPTEEELISLIKPLIPAPKPGKKGDQGSADTGVDILKKIRAVEQDGLEYKDIKNAPSLEALQRIASKTYATRELEDVSMQGIAPGQVLQWDGNKFIPYTPSTSGVNQVFGEVPSGSGTAFTLAHTPIVGTVRLYRGGAYQQSGIGNDYIISGANITLANTLQIGEILLADYNY